MADIARIMGDDLLEIPADVVRRFRRSDRFLVWVDGDTIHLRRLAPSPLDVVAEAPVGEPMTLEEINEVVHEVRRERSPRQ